MLCECEECRLQRCVSYRMMNGHCVTVCPCGVAEGAFHLRNRGMDLVCEVTMWPRWKEHLLTTGSVNNELRNLRFRSEYDYVARFLNISMNQAANWMEEWQKEAKRLVKVREKLRKSKPVIRMNGRFWTVQGRNKEGVLTSAQRKFRAWEDAVRYVKTLEAEKPKPGGNLGVADMVKFW